MNNETHVIEGLKKVTLSFEAGTERNKMGLMARPEIFELILGIGVEGLTPFESMLVGKKAGDMVEFEVQGRLVGETFGHLNVPLTQEVRSTDSFFVKVTVDRIEKADQTEMVKAMAEAVGHCCHERRQGKVPCSGDE